jgi:hypothetical protein
MLQAFTFFFGRAEMKIDRRPLKFRLAITDKAKIKSKKE